MDSPISGVHTLTAFAKDYPCKEPTYISANKTLQCFGELVKTGCVVQHTVSLTGVDKLILYFFFVLKCETVLFAEQFVCVQEYLLQEKYDFDNT